MTLECNRQYQSLFISENIRLVKLSYSTRSAKHNITKWLLWRFKQIPFNNRLVCLIRFLKRQKYGYLLSESHTVLLSLGNLFKRFKLYLRALNSKIYITEVTNQLYSNLSVKIGRGLVALEGGARGQKSKVGKNP